MTKIFLVRHAQAEGNLYRRAHGSYDGLITPIGYQQIEALMHRFENIHIDACYSSDLFRTQTTAEAVYKPRGLTLQLHSGLREIDMGIWENLTWGECRMKNPESHHAYLRCEPDWQVEGSETFSTLVARVSAAIEEIARKHDNETVAIFCHGMAIRNVIASMQGCSVNELPHGENTSVSQINYENGIFEVLQYADASHLSEDISTFAKQSWWRDDKGVAADVNFCFRQLNEVEDFSFLKLAHEDAWQLIYGSSCPNVIDYARETVSDAAGSEYAVRIALLDGNVVGLVQLSPTSGASEGYAHLSFIYLLPEYRQRGLGVQLLGEAISLARLMGQEKLRLHCSQQNPTALKFYAKQGFDKIGEVFHANHTLDVLIKPISAGSAKR